LSITIWSDEGKRKEKGKKEGMSKGRGRRRKGWKNIEQLKGQIWFVGPGIDTL